MVAMIEFVGLGRVPEKGTALPRFLTDQVVDLELGSDVPKCLVDPTLFDTAVLNLVLNARDAMPGGGEIWIGTERLVDADCAAGQPGTYARLRVRDHGCGMSPETMRRIFEPFYTTKSGPDASGKGGTGLGLSTCRDIIEAHHGRIRVDSSLGKGTAFTIKLPVATKSPSRPAVAVSLKGETAVAVEAAGRE